MAKKKKTDKKPPKKDDPQLKVNTSFENLLNMMVNTPIKNSKTKKK